ncbi:uncharacterized protein MYCGRDRAFT_97748 [Zymoseptoria tritici IPO323]|uniref:Uncharacterized protein n=1 Tax=Zymoseptoria tritici (strain CBS 115943 / IPO323) TaxID=336722 RepID=F9XR89_ZYMTI|nr:uncharacterized protein MYCGRDRAFT_97748 [Zymoseptoria tritici IPO323]EGP82216.1 hypothetical protein MYCGRDRAFT_97748 [Zymoseptoria tritici IPO323]
MTSQAPVLGCWTFRTDHAVSAIHTLEITIGSLERSLKRRRPITSVDTGHERGVSVLNDNSLQNQIGILQGLEHLETKALPLLRSINEDLTHDSGFESYIDLRQRCQDVLTDLCDNLAAAIPVSAPLLAIAIRLPRSWTFTPSTPPLAHRVSAVEMHSTWSDHSHGSTVATGLFISAPLRGRLPHRWPSSYKRRGRNGDLSSRCLRLAHPPLHGQSTGSPQSRRSRYGISAPIVFGFYTCHSTASSLGLHS